MDKEKLLVRRRKALIRISMARNGGYGSTRAEMKALRDELVERGVSPELIKGVGVNRSSRRHHFVSLYEGAGPKLVEIGATNIDYSAIGTDEETLCDIIHRLGDFIARAIRMTHIAGDVDRWYRDKFGVTPEFREVYYPDVLRDYFNISTITPAKMLSDMMAEDARRLFFLAVGTSDMDAIEEFREMAGKRIDVDEWNEEVKRADEKTPYPDDVREYFGLDDNNKRRRIS